MKHQLYFSFVLVGGLTRILVIIGTGKGTRETELFGSWFELCTYLPISSQQYATSACITGQVYHLAMTNITATVQVFSERGERGACACTG